MLLEISILRQIHRCILVTYASTTYSFFFIAATLPSTGSPILMISVSFSYLCQYIISFSSSLMLSVAVHILLYNYRLIHGRSCLGNVILTVFQNVVLNKAIDSPC